MHFVIYLVEEITDIGETDLDENHSGDFLSCERFLYAFHHYLDMGLGILIDGFEGEVFDVTLDSGVGPGSADKTFGIEHRVGWVGCELILGGISNQTLAFFRESHVGRSDSVSLIVGDDLNTAVLEDSNTEM